MLAMHEVGDIFVVRVHLLDSTHARLERGSLRGAKPNNK